MAEKKDEAIGHLQQSFESDSKKLDAYANLVRDLTSEELSQSGTQKLIVNDLYKAENKVKELEPYRENYFTVFTEKEILKVQANKSNKSEILYAFAITVGGIIIGLSKMLYDSKPALCVIVAIIGLLLIIGGVVFKFIGK